VPCARSTVCTAANVEHRYHAGAHGCRRGAGLTFSWWSPLLFLFPFTAPLVRPLAAALPDAGFRRILAARRTIKDVAFRLIAAHRAFLAQVAPARPARHAERGERASRWRNSSAMAAVLLVIVLQLTAAKMLAASRPFHALVVRRPLHVKACGC